jgi:hypothetical protein
MMFGFVGFIIGPIVAALFTTIWDIYGIAFKDVLPATGSAPDVLMPEPAPEDAGDPPDPNPDH